ncbi:glycosyltransferase family-like protein [Strigomonas culicis]|uniref:Glycosyltransferase family-like protein n=1 Tax=Strigomonas culicis TaxID=28005 RepID=S9V2A6_9TRYP|nr:glycosyltransferase family-like protein [Strigomonas culicis]|eukprot:EPY21041.1 glycosyltransferase family-like protein [Strigomonas culicis]
MLRRCLPRRTIFDACYVLNLDRRPDRWQHTQQELQKAKLAKKFFTDATPAVAVERVSGVDGCTLDPAQLHRDGVLTDRGYERFQLPLEEKLFGMDLTRGAIGCALGHRAVWERIRARGQQCALVLEDDVEFHHRFSRVFADRWRQVPADWELVHLGGLDLLARGRPPRPYVAEGVRRAYQGHRELTAYVLNARGAARCLALSTPMTWQIDTHISEQLTEEEGAAPAGGVRDKYVADPRHLCPAPVARHTGDRLRHRRAEEGCRQPGP